MPKRTIDNCSMHKKFSGGSADRCGTINEKCEGYASCEDEPHDTCKECELNFYYN